MFSIIFNNAIALLSLWMFWCSLMLCCWLPALVPNYFSCLQQSVAYRKKLSPSATAPLLSVFCQIADQLVTSAALDIRKNPPSLPTYLLDSPCTRLLTFWFYEFNFNKLNFIMVLLAEVFYVKLFVLLLVFCFSPFNLVVSIVLFVNIIF